MYTFLSFLPKAVFRFPSLYVIIVESLKYEAAPPPPLPFGQFVFLLLIFLTFVFNLYSIEISQHVSQLRIRNGYRWCGKRKGTWKRFVQLLLHIFFIF